MYKFLVFILMLPAVYLGIALLALVIQHHLPYMQ